MTNTQARTQSVNRILTLDSRLVSSAMEVYNSCTEDKIPIYICAGYRSNEEQAWMYDIGRFTPGPTLTNDRPKYSANNYGMGLDFCLRMESVNRLINWQEADMTDYWRTLWMKVVRRFESEGWECGWRNSVGLFEPGHARNLLGKDIGELLTAADD